MAKSNLSHTILVFADCGLEKEPLQLGTLTGYASSGGEVFEFEFSQAALAHPQLQAFALDPDLPLLPGRHHCPHGKSNFGIFLDSAPDRWGRKLMQRRLERAKRNGFAPQDQRLIESDFLLGVHDSYRVGALRFKRDKDGPFMDDGDRQAAPPLVKLRALEQASSALDADVDDQMIDEWLRMLIAPGGSLGGARPKASVIAPDGQLMIAKFPRNADKFDIGAWEIVVHVLARACGISVPDAEIRRFTSLHHTFLVKRFDRLPDGTRVHFASAMTLTGHRDGDDAASGASYLELVEVLVAQGADTTTDLNQLWRRIVLNMLVSNTDDHLRNHGFLMVPGRGWKLSPAYDMNPVVNSAGLTLNVSENDNTKDLELALSVAAHFRLNGQQAKKIVADMQHITRQWRRIADGIGISRREQDAMAQAFALSQ